MHSKWAPSSSNVPRKEIKACQGKVWGAPLLREWPSSPFSSTGLGSPCEFVSSQPQRHGHCRPVSMSRRKSLWAPKTLFWLFCSLLSRATYTPCSLAKLHSLYVRKIMWKLEAGRRAGRLFSVQYWAWLSIISEQRLMCKFLFVKDAHNYTRRDGPKDCGLLFP